MSSSLPSHPPPRALPKGKRGAGFYVFCAISAVAVLRLLGMLFHSDPEAAEPSAAPAAGATCCKPRGEAPPPAAAAPAAPEPAAPEPAPAGPSCAQVQPNVMNGRPGLLLDGVPEAGARFLTYVPRRNDPIRPHVPVVSDGQALFVTHEQDELVFAQLAGEELTPAHKVALPKHKGKRLSTSMFTLAAGPKGIGALIQSGRELFFFHIDTKRWSAGKPVLVAAELEQTFWCAPDLVWGDGRWGLVYEGEQKLHWLTLRADGTPEGPASVFAASTSIHPRMAWNGKSFGVLSARKEQATTSLGIWDFSGAEATYQPVIEAPAGKPSYAIDMPNFYPGGWLKWEADQYHVALVRKQHDEDDQTQLVHFAAGKPPRIETCSTTPR